MKYIRFGDIPEGERSGSSKGVTEAGVSVYEARPVHGQWEVIAPDTYTGKLGLSELMDDLFHDYATDDPRVGRPVYLVTGRVVGHGSDGEPLLRDVEIEDQLEYWNLVPVGIVFDEEEGEYRIENGGAEDHYIRFGEWPASERSMVWLPRTSASTRPTHEIGVSVYAARKNDQGKWAIQGDPVVGTLDEFVKELAQGDIEAYLVQGDLVGEGVDREPLLRNLKKVQTLRCEDIYDCEHYLLRTGKLKAKLLR